jgi:hypothetical protein
MTLYDLAGRVAAAGDDLAGAGGRLAALDPGARAFGADATGVLGDLGRVLHERYAAALTARSREAAAHGARLVDLADSLRTAATGYADVEDTLRDRYRREHG